MSRMLGFVSGLSMTPVEALGADLLEEFRNLSHLHADGWGIATAPPIRVATGLSSVADGWPASREISGRSGILYLRFASADSAVSKENLQPFAADGLAFAHNGALAPLSIGASALSFDELHALRGTTDSEVYFALARRDRIDDEPIEESVAGAVALVRSLYPSACLNAMLLDGDDLVVVHSSGTVAPPLAAFSRRGTVGARLPVGHGDDYNLLSTAALRSGARVVATTGVDQTGWTPLANDTVYAFGADGTTRSTPITR
ncbi:class II glutamine amidotransferase [Microbacterium sp. P07]|uniref:class II glutamine amidotransferase n=1 Tax=Microbacterium sp. P07 TaxID=3366952 RepID=UPI00374534E6